MYHIFVFNSSVNEHLGYCHVLAIVNSTAMNIGVHVSFRIVAFSAHTPNSGVAVRRLYTLLHYSCISLYSCQQCRSVPSVSTSFLAFIVCRFFVDGCSDQCGVIPHCSFDLRFCNNTSHEKTLTPWKESYDQPR